MFPKHNVFLAEWLNAFQLCCKYLCDFSNNTYRKVTRGQAMCFVGEGIQGAKGSMHGIKEFLVKETDFVKS